MTKRFLAIFLVLSLLVRQVSWLLLAQPKVVYAVEENVSQSEEQEEAQVDETPESSQKSENEEVTPESEEIPQQEEQDFQQNGESEEEDETSSDQSETPDLPSTEVDAATSSSEITENSDPATQLATTSAELKSGEADSNATNLIDVNTTQVNSQLEVTQTNLDQDDGDLIITAPEQNESGVENPDPDHEEPENDSDTSSTTVANQATVSAQTIAAANTGNNHQQATVSAEKAASSSATLETGNAVSTATTLATVNNTLINSQARYDVINILRDYSGNVILENPYYVANSFEDWLENQSSCDDNCLTDQYLAVRNQAIVNNIVSADAQTGNNSQQVSSASATNVNLTTGQARSLAVAETDVNITYLNYLSYLMRINILAEWGGLIYGWESPESVQRYEQTDLEFTQFLSEADQSQPELSLQHNSNQIEVSNQAEINIVTQAMANTGNNTQNLTGVEEASLKTGDATAVASSYVLANSTLVNSQIQQTQLNVLDDWMGNLIFAYPDLEVNLIESSSQAKSKDKVTYVLEVVNKGLIKARDVVISQTLPLVSSFTVNEAAELEQEDDTWSWQIGELAAGERKSFNVEAWLNGLPTELTSLSTQVSVGGRDVEAMGNNNLSVDIPVFSLTQVTRQDEIPAETEEVDNYGQFQNPDFRLGVKQNVNQFVYLGDTVIFEVSLYNQGGVSSDTMLYTALLDGNGEMIGGGSVPLQTVALGEDINLSFQMSIPAEANAGEYELLVWADGYNQDNQLYNSDQVGTIFSVRNWGSQLGNAEAQNEGVILGAENIFQPTPVLGATTEGLEAVHSNQDSLSFYLKFILLLLILLSIETGVRQLKTRINQSKNN